MSKAMSVEEFLEKWASGTYDPYFGREEMKADLEAMLGVFPICRECNGKGWKYRTTENSSSSSQCLKCNGTGKSL